MIIITVESRSNICIHVHVVHTIRYGHKVHVTIQFCHVRATLWQAIKHELAVKSWSYRKNHQHEHFDFLATFDFGCIWRQPPDIRKRFTKFDHATKTAIDRLIVQHIEQK